MTVAYLNRAAARRYGSSVARGGNVEPARTESLPAPVGGWNARDSFANMDPLDAITLINMFPTVSTVQLRGGHQRDRTGLMGQVQTLMTYNGGNVTQMFAITDAGFIYDVSSSGAVGAPVVTGLTNGIWEYANISTSGGSFLYAVNGVDKPLFYDGAAWVSVDGVSTPAITGITTTKLCNVVLFKHRLWFIEQYTLNLWYLDTDAIGGAAHKFPLNSIARSGGHAVDLETWTLDAGYGADDNLVFITSLGEVIVYSGTDPDSIDTFALIGVWQLGSPIGTRSMLKWGGDVLILTFDGLLPLAASLQSSRLDPRVALSDKIQGAITAATTAYGGSHSALGWQVVYNAKQNAVMINVPVSSDGQQQYVMNTVTKSWCQFTGWAANCWANYNDDAYFGGDGFVAKAFTTDYADNGASIPSQTIQAFNYFGERGVKKYFTRARPSIFTNGSPSINVGMNVDFDLSDTTTPISFLPITFATWDVSLWDVGIWGSGLSVNNTWLGITGLGYCGALQMKTATSGLQIQWASTDVVYQLGWSGI